MNGINWNILAQAAGPQDIGQSVNSGFDRGMGLARDHQLQNALASLGSGSNDPAALATVYRYSPQLAATLESSQRERQEYERGEQYRSALAEHLRARGGTNSLLQSSALPSPSMGAVAQSGPPAAPVQNALAPGFGATNESPGPIPDPGIGDPAGGRSMAQQADPQQAAYERMIAADPVKAMEFRKQWLSDKMAEAHNIAQLAGSANDQASYSAALRRAASMGIDISALPQEYDPEVVDRILLQAMDAKAQVAALQKQAEFDWRREDDEIDNKREARNTDSLIEYRGGQLAIGEERNRVSERNNRRSTATSRANTLTGQAGAMRREIFQTRAESAGLTGRGRGRRRGGAAAPSGPAEGAVIRNPSTGQTAVRRGGQWVDQKTGQPVAGMN